MVRQKKLIEASRTGNYELVKQLLNTTYVDTVDEFGSTPLIETGKFSSKYFFSSHKFYKKFFINYFSFPKYIAAVNGYWKIAEILLDQGADINHQNVQGNTPLILAGKYY